MVNKVILVGSLAHDPELRKTNESGDSVVNVKLVVKSPLDKDAELIPITAFKGKAELLGKYGRKGKKIFCEGALRAHTRISRSGEEIHGYEVILSEFRWLDDAPGY